ncbi:MAG: uroporphyrinogen-III synthase [Gammaproteobacteria bacterium]|nr:uroporphyrinogen-III synthase [Gammaproteobacteria bacterium]
MEQNLPLSKTSIVVTRPSLQNKNICTQLSSMGAIPIAFPCIEISPILNIDTSNFDKVLPNCDLVIFISTNAVHYGLKTMPNLFKQVPESCQFAAVGASTAQALSEYGVKRILCPSDKFDSEQLLKLPELEKLNKKSVLIVKGKDGQKSLHHSLESRGANVLSVDVYQRTLPKSVNLDAINTKIDLLLFTSSETANNFLELAPNSLKNTLLACQTLVGHKRIAEKVTSLGFKKLPIIAATPSDTDMLAAINLWALNGP